MYGKVRNVTKLVDSKTIVTSYLYDAAGNRILKRILEDGVEQKTTTHIRDASGNVMQTAITKIDTTEYEYPLYGSNRLGMYRGGTDKLHRMLGNKHYELSNHLGNVLAVVSDARLGEDSTSNGQYDYYLPHVVSLSDYYPFGLAMPNREYKSSEYRWGFQGQEHDNDFFKYAVEYKFRIHNPAIGRFFAVDPLTSKYPHYSPYSFSGNKVIHRVELEGLEDGQINVNSGDLSIRLLDKNRVDAINKSSYIEGHKYRVAVGEIAVGFLPLGWISNSPDAVSMAANLYRGNWGGALFDGISLLPGGDLIKVMKQAKRISKAVVKGSSKIDFGLISKHKEVGLGYSGIMTKDGKLSMKLTVDDKLLPGDNFKQKLLDFGEKIGEAVKSRRGSHESSLLNYQKSLGMAPDPANKMGVYGFALNASKENSKVIEVGFYSAGINKSQGLGKVVSDVDAKTAKRYEGILNDEAQEAVLKKLKEVFGDEFKFIKKPNGDRIYH